MQGVINAFVMFIARVVAYVLTRGSRDGRGMYFIIMYVFQFILLILGSMLVAAYSRRRECQADRSGAQLAGRERMIKGLEALKRTYEQVDQKAQPALQTLKISSQPQGIWKLFSTHPPLEERIARLKTPTHF